MIWLWIVLGALTGVVLLLTVAGMAFDRRHVATVQFRLSRPPEEVFAVIADPSGAVAWRGDLRRVEMLGTVAGRMRFREHGRHGSVLYEVVRTDPPRHHEVCIADDRLPYGGCWRFDLEPEGGGTRVTVTEDGFISNPVFRALSRTVFSLTSTLESYARALGSRFGEQVAPIASVVHGGPPERR